MDEKEKRPSVSRTIDKHSILNVVFWCALSTSLIPIVFLIILLISLFGG
ncbi:hypothetical protein LCGC14_2958400 [marine sediment metagenome]|uniref:Uncharacterized protein n=1 Tax=marine sediment metagenome TaxID=412755 RepID=A0A0F9A4B2_9ZZZZ